MKERDQKRGKQRDAVERERKKSDQKREKGNNGYFCQRSIQD